MIHLLTFLSSSLRNS